MSQPNSAVPPAPSVVSSQPSIISSLGETASDIYDSASNAAVNVANTARDSFNLAEQQLESVTSPPLVTSEPEPVSVVPSPILATSTRKRRVYDPKRTCNPFRKSKRFPPCPKEQLVAKPMKQPRTRKHVKHTVSPSRYHKALKDVKEYRKNNTKIRHLLKDLQKMVQ